MCLSAQLSLDLSLVWAEFVELFTPLSGFVHKNSDLISTIHFGKLESLVLDQSLPAYGHDHVLLLACWMYFYIKFWR